MSDALEIIGLITVFLGGGILFAGTAAMITAAVFARHGIGAMVFADLAFKIAVVVWCGLFVWFGPITISIGVSQ